MKDYNFQNESVRNKLSTTTDFNLKTFLTLTYKFPENDNTAILLIEFLIKSAPLFKKYGAAIEELERLNGNLTNTIKLSETKDNFDDTMKNFFEKMNW